MRFFAEQSNLLSSKAGNIPHMWVADIHSRKIPAERTGTQRVEEDTSTPEEDTGRPELGLDIHKTLESDSSPPPLSNSAGRMFAASGSLLLRELGVRSLDRGRYLLGRLRVRSFDRSRCLLRWRGIRVVIAGD